MTSTTLKILAFFCMLIDHIGVFIPGSPIWFRWIGRLAQPIFLYCLLWSIRLTKHRVRFLLRLYLAGVSMGIVSFFCNNLINPSVPIETNIFTSFFVISLVIIATEPLQNIKISKFHFNQIQLISTLIIATGILTSKISEVFDENTFNYFKPLLTSLFPSVINCEVGVYYIALAVLMYFWLDSPVKLYIVFGIYFLLPAIVLLLLNFQYATLLTNQFQWMAVFSIPFFMCYNKQRGHNIKFLFYFGYIIHLPLLCLIGNAIST